jgi:beta-galactosidase
MMTRFLLLFAMCIASCLSAAQLSFGTATLINESWAFALQDDARAKEPDFNDGAWPRVDLPHDWSIKQRHSQDLASGTGYLPGGVGWYRKSLKLPFLPNGEKVYLYFEGVYNRSELYVNGHKVGNRPNGYVSFYYDITPFIRFDQENVIAVRVDHSRYADSRWYTGSGIYRDVYVVRSGRMHIAPWGVFVQTRRASPNTAELQVQTELQNETDSPRVVQIRHELFGSDGTPACHVLEKITVPPAAALTARTLLQVAQPKLWSVDAPNLYRLKTSVVSETGEPLDATETTTGVREFSFDPNKGFALNGHWMKVKGVCIHHDAGVLGAAVPKSVWRQRLQTLKSIGTNAIRMSHNPQASAVYELCDELGLLVLDEAFDEWEFPKRKWIQGWNVGQPGFDGAFDFFEGWGTRDLADMVRRNRNHPCIFAWSIGNEVDYPNDPYSHPVLDRARIDQPTIGKYNPESPKAERLGAIAKRLAAEVRKHDPSRPVTAALAGVVMSNETEYPSALDIVGYNYTEDRYAQDHVQYPQRVIYGSENRHTYAAWTAVRDNAHIFGQFLWTGIDYLGEAGRWPSRGSTAGLLDLTGAVKPRGRFREALWSARPVVYLGTEKKPDDDRKSIDAQPSWNYESGTEVRVLCYTNAAKVRLLLNGRPIADPKGFDEATGVISWDMPFEPGILEAIALNSENAEVARSAIRTATAPATLQIEPAHTSALKGFETTMIAVEVLDQAGVRVLHAEPEITCEIEGPARLLGLENSDNRDVSDFTDSTHRAFRGRLVAYVQATGQPGTIRVRFSTAGLKEAQTVLTAR